MLDLIVFGIAAIITRRVCGAASDTTATDKQQQQHGDPIIQRKLARHLFQISLFLSLLLFSLAILEATPLSWSVLIYRASILQHTYRIILWCICLLLLIVHPVCFALAILHSKTSSLNSSSSSSSLPLPTVRNRVTIILQLIWAAMRFFAVAIIWRFILQKICRMVLPRNFFISNHNTENDDRNNTRQQKWMQLCSFSVVLLSSILICLTFVCLGAMRSIVIKSSTSNNSLDYAYDSTDEVGKQWLSPLKTMVTMICSFGLIIASILNGFGCSSLPHSNLVGIFLKPTPVAMVTKLENDIYYAKSQLEEKRCLLADIIQSSNNRRASSSSSATFTSASNAEKQKAKQLQDEVIFLTYLVGDMVDDIEEMKQSQQLAIRARTSVGKIRVVLGIIFSIVLVIRIVLASKSFSLLFQDEQEALQSPRDPVTSIVLWLIGNNIVNEDQYNYLAQGTSLVLAGLLSISQVSSFLRVVSALGRKMNKILGSTGGLSTGTADHHLPVAKILASFVMGSYFLSCVVVVKLNVPVEYRASFSSAIGFNFDFNTTVLNVIFFAAAIVSALVLGLLFGIQRSHSTRYQFESQLNTPLVSAQLP